jgi:hypothetical protein
MDWSQCSAVDRDSEGWGRVVLCGDAHAGRIDVNTPAPLARFPGGHEVTRAAKLGWRRVLNGALLDGAGRAGFDLPVRCD